MASENPARAFESLARQLRGEGEEWSTPFASSLSATQALACMRDATKGATDDGD